MTPEEFESLNQPTNNPNDEIKLWNTRDRTLIYGYDCDRNTHHVYLQNGVVYRVAYDSKNRLVLPILSYKPLTLGHLSSLMPNKSIYPDRCDYEFCAVLQKLQVYLPFTTMDKKLSEFTQTYHGLIIISSYTLNP